MFKQKIQDFNLYNPSFGRKIINTARSMFGDIVEDQPVNIRFIDHCVPLLLSDVMYSIKKRAQVRVNLFG